MGRVKVWEGGRLESWKVGRLEGWKVGRLSILKEMKFRTEFEAVRASVTLDPSKPVVLAGSCFSQNMASMMEAHQWRAVNPLGTLYNPLSICLALDFMLDDEKGVERFEQSLFQYDGVWNSDKFDSSFSSVNREDCIREFLMRKKELVTTLEEGQLLIVTFGTSIVYYTVEDRTPVGNCHKQPSQLFYRDRMSISDVFSYWEVVLEKIQERFPGIKIIFTVSPVRHLKDGFVGNIRSKAILALGIAEILKYHNDCFYFPAYEILNDDLRDYRFYADDLVHPSGKAVEYIWDKFLKTFLDDHGIRLLEEGGRKVKASLHRPKLGALGKPIKD